MKDDELRIQTESSSLSEAALEGYVREIREQVPNCSVFIQEKILATRFFDRHPDDNRKVTGTEYWPFFVSVYLLKPLAGQKRIAHVDENIDDAMRHILDRIRRLKNIQKQEEEQA